MLISQMDFVSSYYLIPIHFLNSVLMEGYYNKHLFPVSASFISLHRCHCICVLSCGYVGLSVRRQLRIFGMMSLKIGYRILNYSMNFRSLIFGFYLSLGIPQFLFKVIFFVAVIVLSTHSYLEFICVGCYCNRFLFVGLVHQTLRKLGRCQMTQLL